MNRILNWKTRAAPSEYIWYARAPFVMAAVGGGALLVILKSVGVGQLWVTSTAVVLMLLYAVSVFQTPVLRLREDLIGDNCYYLGFLYTLFSLSWALYDFSSSGDTNLIVANFGLALGSTIAGVTMRVVINQSRRDVLETEQDARIELSNAVTRMRAKIEDAVLALDSFCRSVQQTASEQIYASAESASLALEAGVSKVGESSTRVLERIDEAFTEFREHTAQLNETSSANVKAFKALLKKIENIEAPSDLVSRRFDSILGSAESAASRISAALEHGEEMAKDVTESRQVIGEQLKALSENIASTASGLENAVHSIERVMRATEQSVTTLGSYNLRGSLDDVTQTLKRHNEELESELQRTRRMVANTGTALAELADSVVAKLA